VLVLLFELAQVVEPPSVRSGRPQARKTASAQRSMAVTASSKPSDMAATSRISQGSSKIALSWSTSPMAMCSTMVRPCRRLQG